MKPTPVYSSDPARGWIPWAALAPFLGVLFVAAPLLGVSKVLEALGLVDALLNPLGLAGLAAFLVFPFSGIGLAVLAWVRFAERRPFASIGLASEKKGKRFLRGWAIGVGTSFTVVAAIWAAGGYEARAFGEALGSPKALMSIALLAVGFAVQSSAEELLFRGWLLSAMARKVHVAVAAGAVSTVFALLHFSPGQHLLVTLNLFLFGVFTCAWAVRGGHIWTVMGWHAGWNWLLGIGFDLPVTGVDTGVPALLVQLTPRGSDPLTGGAQGPEGSFVCTLLFVAGIAGIAGIARRSKGCRSRTP